MAINFPEGTQDFPSKVLQVKQGWYSGNQYVTSTGSGASQFGLIYNRVYGDLVSVDLTPLSSSSVIIVQGCSGGSNSNMSFHGTGAFGVVVVVNNGTSNNIDNTDYQYYPITNPFGSGTYLPNTMVQGRWANSGTSTLNFKLKGYSYSENNNQNRVQFKKAHLWLMEVV